MELEALRREIDEVDRQLIALAQQRMDVAAAIGEYKRQHGLPVLDAGRERVKLDTVARQSRAGMETYMQQLFVTLMAMSRDHQQALMEGRHG